MKSLVASKPISHFHVITHLLSYSLENTKLYPPSSSFFSGPRLLFLYKSLPWPPPDRLKWLSPLAGLNCMVLFPQSTLLSFLSWTATLGDSKPLPTWLALCLPVLIFLFLSYTPFNLSRFFYFRVRPFIYFSSSLGIMQWSDMCYFSFSICRSSPHQYSWAKFFETADVCFSLLDKLLSFVPLIAHFWSPFLPRVFDTAVPLFFHQNS